MTNEAYHGGVDRESLLQRGIDPRAIIDLSSNILPVEHPAAVRDAIGQAAISAYPDRNCGLLRDALARRHGLDRDEILVGNGCCELIHLVAAAVIGPGDAALVIGPTFSEYARGTVLAGGTVDEVRAAADDDFAVPVAAIEASLARRTYAAVWICYPNNPTGRCIDLAVVKRWMTQYPETVFIIDESYLDFVAGAQSTLTHRAANLIVLRSMTKAYALAGLRLGYLVAATQWMQQMIARRVPWTVNAVAQAAGIAVLESQATYDAAADRLRLRTSYLVAELQRRGYRPLPSQTGYFLLNVGDADRFCQRMLAAGILIRDATSFGLPVHVRIAVGDDAATTALLQALEGDTTAPLEGTCETDAATLAGVEPQHLPMQSAGAGAAAAVEADVPVWDDRFREQLNQLFRMRRDVRRFRSDPIPAGATQRWLDAACLAPSVGLSQPWRFISVESPATRRQVIAEFEIENARAAAMYDDATAAEYRQLKLAGLREAPEHLAVFAEPSPQQGRGLGRQTMPETVAYSVVAAIQNFWLAARSEGVGVGWVSILQPDRIGELLDVPDNWQLIAYLCIGYPLDSPQSIPELERLGWQQRRGGDSVMQSGQDIR